MHSIPLLYPAELVPFRNTQETELWAENTLGQVTPLTDEKRGLREGK